MKESAVYAGLLTDLARSETEYRELGHRLTYRAELYMGTGVIDLDSVLRVLGISRATWYRRVEALRAWEAKISGRSVEDQAVAVVADALADQA